MKRRALFWGCLFMLCGMVVGSLVFPEPKAFSFSFVLLLVSAIGFFIYFRFWGKTLFFALFFLFFGFFYYGWFDRSNTSQLPVGKVTFTGTIIDSPVFDGDKVRMTLRLTQVNQSGIPKEDVAVQLFLTKAEEVEKGKKIFVYHRELSGSLELSVPEGPRNPGSFDYRQYLYWKGIHRQGIINDFAHLSYRSNVTWSITGMLYALRGKLNERIHLLYGEETAGLISGFILGLTDDTDPSVSLLFSNLGLSHILAISGQHISLLAIGLLLLMRSLNVTRERAYEVTMFFIPLYVGMTGASPSAIRAFIMGELLLVGLRFRFFRDGLNAIALAFILMVLGNPYYIHDIGFQLSFLVTFGILIFVPPLMKVLPIKMYALKGLTAVTLAATLISFPLTIYYFHRFSLLSPFVNFLVVPIFEFIIAPLSTISVLFGIITPEAGRIYANFVELVIQSMIYCLKWLDKLEYLRLIFKSPPILWIFGYILWLILLFFLFYSKVDSRRYRRATCAGFVILLTLLIFLQQADAQTVRITILDVGQGDSIVVETPEAVTVIDCGGAVINGREEEWQKHQNSFDPSKNVLIPYLYYRGIQKIDALILTHWDNDHVGGAPYLLQHFPVDRVVMNGEPQNSISNGLIQRIMNEREIPQEIAGQDQTWNSGNQIHWKVLNPVKGSQSDNDNDQSLVLLLEAYGHRVLFTGDLEENGEKRLLAGKSFWPIDVLKVGHHGSKSSTSQEWVETLRPRLSVISVGKRNRYGHPNPEVIQRLQKLGGEIKRTDQLGAITILLDKNQVRYQTNSFY